MEPTPSASVPSSTGRSLLGLPARLALLTLGVIAICLLGLSLFSGHQLQKQQDRSATEEGRSAGLALRGRFTDIDFVDGVIVRTQLNDRLSAFNDEFPRVAQVHMYAVSKGAVTALATSTGRGRTTDLAAAKAHKGVRTTLIEHHGSGITVWVPGPVDQDGHHVGFFRLDLGEAAGASQLRVAKRTNFLASLFAASLLGFVLLSLLQRELFRPLLHMRSVMTQIRGGATGVRIGWNRSDELGATADDFDAMVEELEATQKELARFVNRDPLTGLLNAQSFTDRVSGELTRARREGYPVSLVVIDIDGLGEVNSRHDEDAGDNVLRALGEVIATCVRPTDICGRIVDDEMQVALVGADVTQAVGVLQRLRREVANSVLVGPEREPVTVSIGLAQYPDHAVDQLELARRAANALEAARRTGDGRAMIWGERGGYRSLDDLAPMEAAAPAAVGDDRAELAGSVHALARAFEGRFGNSDHSANVARYALALARRRKLPEAGQQELRSAAVVHDIGKIAVDPEVLALPAGKLSDAQREQLEQAPSVARAILLSAGMDGIAGWVYHGAERYDGSGFPDGLAGDDIPLESRILQLANALDRIVGRGPADEDAVVAELRANAGTQFDPALVDDAVALIGDGLIATRLAGLHDGADAGEAAA